VYEITGYTTLLTKSSSVLLPPPKFEGQADHRITAAVMS
jgi:hypothetical protein